MEKLFGIVSAVIGVYLSVHCFYSYILLKGMFEAHGVGLLPLIGFEDIVYSTGMINYIILITMSLGLIAGGIVIVMSKLNDFDDVYARVIKKSNGVELNDKIKVSAGIVILGWSIWSYIMETNFIVYYSIMCLIACPLCCFVWKKQSLYILFTFWILTFFVGLAYILQTVKPGVRANNNIQFANRLSFRCNGILKEEKGVLVYSGYKYIVVCRDHCKEHSFYPTDQISNMKYVSLIK